MIRLLLAPTIMLLLTTPVFADLTPKDLEKIQTIVKEEIKELEERTDLKLARLQIEINSLESRIDEIKWWIGGSSILYIALIIFTLRRTSEEVDRVKAMRDDTEQFVKDFTQLIETLDELFQKNKEHLKN